MSRLLKLLMSLPLIGTPTFQPAAFLSPIIVTSAAVVLSEPAEAEAQWSPWYPLQDNWSNGIDWRYKKGSFNYDGNKVQITWQLRNRYPKAVEFDYTIYHEDGKPVNNNQPVKLHPGIQARYSGQYTIAHDMTLKITSQVWVLGERFKSRTSGSNSTSPNGRGGNATELVFKPSNKPKQTQVPDQGTILKRQLEENKKKQEELKRQSDERRAKEKQRQETETRLRESHAKAQAAERTRQIQAENLRRQQEEQAAIERRKAEIIRDAYNTQSKYRATIEAVNAFSNSILAVYEENERQATAQGSVVKAELVDNAVRLENELEIILQDPLWQYYLSAHPLEKFGIFPNMTMVRTEVRALRGYPSSWFKPDFSATHREELREWAVAVDKFYKWKMYKAQDFIAKYVGIQAELETLKRGLESNRESAIKVLGKQDYDVALESLNQNINDLKNDPQQASLLVTDDSYKRLITEKPEKALGRIK